MNKKGDSDQSSGILGVPPNILIGALVVFLVVLWIAPMGFKVLTLVTKESKDQVSIQSYDRLVGDIDQLLNSRDTILEKQPIQLKEGYAIVGFNKENIGKIDACPPSEEINKPKSCGEGACLCLYKDTDADFSKSKLVKCESYNDIAYFVSVAYWQASGNPDLYSGELFFKSKKAFPNYELNLFMNVMGYPYDASSPIIFTAQFNRDYLSHFVLYGMCPSWDYSRDLNVVAINIMKKEINGEIAVFLEPII